MARDQATIECPKGVWTQLTNGDASSITFAVLRGRVYIRYTTDATTPTAAYGVPYSEGQGESKAVSELVALSGADRVWALSPLGTALVYVDHA